MTHAMVEKKQKERKFLEQLLDGKKVENYTIPVPIKAELRKYQQVSPFMLVTAFCLSEIRSKTQVEVSVMRLIL